MPSSDETSLAPSRWRGLLGLVLGPLALLGWTSKAGALFVTLLLTLLTQVGGLVLWPVWTGLFEVTRPWTVGPRWISRICGLVAVYLVGCQAVLPWVASLTGRVRLPQIATQDTPVGPLWWGFPLMNRNYVRPHTQRAFVQAARRTAERHPGTVVRYLDAGFPFPFPPLLPHLSHADGQRIDVALLFEVEGSPVDGALSPIGYWGFARESANRPECDGVRQSVGPLQLDLRWDFGWAQGLWPARELDVDRNRTFFSEVAREPQVCSILLEPTLHKLLSAPKLRANGCAVARHDDHSHLSIKASCR